MKKLDFQKLWLKNSNQLRKENQVVDNWDSKKFFLKTSSTVLIKAEKQAHIEPGNICNYVSNFQTIIY